MNKVIDSNGETIYSGSLSDCERVIFLATCDPSEVTEQDEITYDVFLHSEWHGKLYLNKLPIKVYKLKFEGIDSWNRAVFKKVDTDIRIGCTDKLFSRESNDEIIKYFEANPNQLCYFGTSFDCEPEGSKYNTNVKFEFV